MEAIPARNPKTEARTRLGARYEVRILEPSPPAVGEPPFFADDPAPRGGYVADRLLVSPIGDGDLTWDSLCRDDPDLEPWCAKRWLGGWDRLGLLPAGFSETRESLRRLAVYVLAPARKAANGKIGLRFTAGGFGTPFFGADEQLRVEGPDVVRQLGDQAWAQEIGTLAEAADFADVELPGVEQPGDPGVGSDLAGLGDPGALLPVDADASAAIGDWFGFGASVLERFRAERRATGAEVTRVQLWPEHFDLAFDDGAANFGCSPGDAWAPEPYVYVGPRNLERLHLEGLHRDGLNREGQPGEYWNAPFGAALSYSELLAASDQRETALGFLRQGLAAIG